VPTNRGSPGEEAVKWMSLISIAIDWVAKGAYCTACKNPTVAILRTKIATLKTLHKITVAK